MPFKAIAIGILLLLPQLGFVWTDAKAKVAAQASSEDARDREQPGR